jgi:putative ABC transport system permease protein
MLEGHWFNQEDDAFRYEPVIINKKLKEAVFENGNAIGKFLEQRENGRVVIGVFDQIKKQGELNDFGNILFKRINPNNPESWVGENIIFKVKPGTGIDFEEKLLRRLSNISKNFTLEIRQMADMRKRSFDKYSSVAYIFGFIALFLIINVTLGLFGVLWYNINFRKSEIGIRRSFGSTARNIYSQIVSETLVISTFSLILGSFLIFQLYVFISGWLRADIFYISYFLSVFLVYLITIICAFYPSKLAAKIEPSEALHDE